VIEISVLDLISQSTRGQPINKMALNWNAAESRYQNVRRLPLVAMISPQFVRRREDKSANKTDVAHGESVTYTFDVTYAPGADGSPAHAVSVSDPQCSSAVTGPDKSTTVDADNDADTLLEAGETWRYSCTYAVPASHTDGEEDPILNIAHADALSGPRAEYGRGTGSATRRAPALRPRRRSEGGHLGHRRRGLHRLGPPDRRA
jgi:hypothetical protein